MRIDQFEIKNERNIILAKCDAVPPIMVVTGPNGSGKSTLLQALRNHRGKRPMYIGPHRSSRRQQVQFRYLGPQINLRSVLEGEELPGYEGIRNISRRRTAWDHDDAPSFIKYGLCQIELDRREAIADRYDEHKEIGKASLPDVWSPLRQMAENLLPHLTFAKIDTSDRQQVRCLWNVHGQQTQVDIDDLSSGEKSIIQLFYPLLEHRIRSILQELKGVLEDPEEDPVCVLMDEPELHLHPNLQTKILDYIRRLTLQENSQFIIATHSPTIVENANSDELFLLRPSEMVAPDANQLIRIATDEKKLQVLRDVFGSTSNLTAMRPILVVEGKHGDRKSKRAVDARIYAFLSEEFNKITIIPSGGKSECKRLVRNLTDALQSLSTSLKAYALLDRDLEEEEGQEPDVRLLPVSMVENLLVDPAVIWNATSSVHHKMNLSSVQEVEAALNEILDGMEDQEVARRIRDAIGPKTFRLDEPVEEAEKQLIVFVNSLKDELSTERMAKLSDDFRAKVSKIKSANNRREYFHGKKILEAFYTRHIHRTGMPKEIFIYDCAKQASARNSVREFVGQLMQGMGLRSDNSVQAE